MRGLAAVMALATAFWLHVGAGSARSAELTFFEPGKIPALVEFSAGAFAAINSQGRDATALFQLDGISSWTIVNFWDYFQLNPYIGGFVTAKGSKMGYVGIHGTAPIGEHFELSPFFGIGAYDKGDGRDLGSTALFQAGLSGMYVFDSGYRVGLAFTHESNGEVLPRNHSGCLCNPGANNFLLTVAVPFAKLMPPAN